MSGTTASSTGAADASSRAALAASFERAAGRDRARRAGPRVSRAEPAELSVAVASHNRRDALREALDALARQTYPREKFEVVVVLDGSTDGSAEMVRAQDYPYDVRVVEQENRGLSSARNRGAAEGTRDVVVFSDDDIFLDPHCLEAYAREHAGRGAGEMVLGVAWPQVGADVRARTVGEWWARHYRRKADPGHRWTFMDVADGMASMSRRLFLESGGFDESFRERRQDWEWGIRLFERDIRFTQSLEASGRHLVDTSIPTMVRHARAEARSDVQLAEKHPGVRGRLLLARFAQTRMAARRARAVFSAGPASEAALRAAVPVAVRLIRARGRPALERIVGRLRTHAYVLGLRDALGSREAFDEFLAPIARREDLDTLTVELDRPGELDVPPVGGAVEVSVLEGGKELVRVPAMSPGEQWDWDALTERVVDALLGESTQDHRP